MSVSEMNVGQIRRSHVFMRAISIVVLITFASMTISPGAQAIAQTVENATTSPPEETTGNPHADKLEQVKGKLRDVSDKRAKGQSIATEKAALRELRSQLKALDTQTLAEFDAVEQHIKDKNLPDLILQRHRDAVQKFKEESAKTDAELADLDSTSDETAVATKSKALSDRLEGIQTKRRHQPFDPNNLPFRASDRKPVPPRTKPEEFSALFPLEPMDGVRLASTSPFSLLPALQAAVGVPGPEYLAATEDVQITQEIRDLAAALNNNPVEIYNWVYNNIHPIPTFGSVQGSTLTLQNGEGNAFDTASLLIALLRSAGIPSRYAYGTVDIPAAQAMNWVGGVTTADQAQTLLGQGGVPTTAVTSGGVIKALRIEHIWVEAFVDFTPSRGVVNKAADSWVPMDPTFKQYLFEPAIDFKTLVPFETTAAANQLRSTASINDAQGTIQSIDLAQVREIHRSYRSRLDNYLEQNNPEVTAVDLLDGRRIVQRSSPVLAASLPYRKIASGPFFASIPASLRHSVTISLFASQLNQSLDSPVVQRTMSLPSVGSRRISVSHRPASSADAQVIQSILDQGGSSLPAYLINVVPQLKFDEQVLAEAPAATMGQAQIWQVRLTGPGQPESRVVFSSNVAGDELVFSINGNGLSGDSVLARMASASGGSASESLHLAAMTYWTAHDWFDRFSASAYKARAVRLPSVALASAGLTPSYYFGIARKASFLGRTLDAKRVYLAAVAPDTGSLKGFLIQAGVQGSQFEASAFNSTFGRPQGTALSATEYLNYAALQGIPIHAITPQNSSAVLPLLNVSAAVREDIAAALSRGQLVITRNEMSQPEEMTAWVISSSIRTLERALT